MRKEEGMLWRLEQGLEIDVGGEDARREGCDAV